MQWLESETVFTVLRVISWILCGFMLPVVVAKCMRRKVLFVSIARRHTFLGLSVALSLMVILLIPVAYALRNHFFSIASGDLLEYTFRSDGGGGQDSDVVAIHRSLRMFAYLAMIALPYVATSCLLVERRTRLGYWVLFLLVLSLASCLLCALIPGVYGLLKYIDAMGITPKRIAGLFYSATCIVVTAGAVWWAAWPPKKKTA
jgi:hypothetical protein